MALQLSEVDLTKDFDQLITCMWESYENPFQPFFRFFCPILNDDREASIKESTARFLEWQQHDPHARWLKVADPVTGKIAGAAWYKIFTENPFANDPDVAAYWYPDASSNDFAGQAIGMMEDVRREKATRPQVCKWTDLSGFYTLLMRI